VTSTTWDSRPELPEGAPPPDDRPPWKWWMGPVAVLLAIIIANVLGLLVFGIAVAFGDDLDDPGPATLIAATIVQDLVFVATAIGFAATVRIPAAADFGLRGTRFWPAVGWSALTLVAIYIVLAATSALFGVQDTDQENIIDDLGVKQGTFGVYALAFVVCVMAPLAEEVLFRGFVFRSMAPRLGVVWAALVSGVIFGGIHVTNYSDGDSSLELAAASVISLMFLGTAFAFLYWKTGSLLPCIALHSINNSIAFGTMQDWSWEILVLLPAALLTCAVAVWAAMRWWRGRELRPQTWSAW
jgi:membrane protease YdiL (CAAX protease family)